MMTQPFNTRRVMSIAICCAVLIAGSGPWCDAAEREASSEALRLLGDYLGQPRGNRPDLSEQTFATAALTRKDAAQAARLLWDDYAAWIRDTRAAEMEKQEIVLGELKMPFFVKIFGEKPEQGRSLFISMHGGGNAPPRVNDQQWKNQQRLYAPAQGVYVAPRAPTNTWNLWHQKHIDSFYDRLITNLVVLENVDPNRVYIMGYSAGGDGVYQLAPRMADRLAAAAMMAGHPNETSPLGLRNLAFTIHVGGRDAGYNRNEQARQWKEKLAELRAADMQGYEHLVVIHEEHGHWMDRKDAVAVEWMAERTRNPFPQHIVWRQDDVTHARFYWLAVDAPQPRSELTATLKGQSIEIASESVDDWFVMLNDHMLDMDQDVTIRAEGKIVYQGRVDRTIKTLDTTLHQRGDPVLVFSGIVRGRVRTDSSKCRSSDRP